MLKSIIILVFLLSHSLLAAQKNISQIINKTAPSSTVKFHHEITDIEGNESSLPIAIIKGKQEGPTFTIIAGVHGYEYPPIIATQNLIQEINPELLSGTLVLIPMANPNSFYKRSPFLNPQDHLNLNRVFPGNSEGSITQKIADYITNDIIATSDVFLDVHGGDANEDLLPFVCYYNNQSRPSQTAQSKILSEASGFKYIVSYPYTITDDEPAKYAFKQAVQDGKVGLSIECSKLGNLQEDAIILIKNGVYNMLHEMEMYPEERAKNEFIVLNQQAYVRSSSQGIFTSNYTAGDHVNKDDILGQITDEFGDIISTITSDHSGIILYKIGTPPVNVGETIMSIGYGG